MIMVSAMALAFTFSGCENKRENNNAHYYSIDSLVKAQVIFLPKVKAAVTKETLLDHQSAAVVTFTPRDTMLWSKELEVFAQLKDINKPINKGAYLVEDGLLDTQSNLKVKLFTGTPAQKVRWMKLYYHNVLSKLKKVEALFNEENPLYESSRILTMEFQELNNKTVLTSYSIVGGQKMFTADSVTFSIQGKIKIY
jgi:hypothetical protein